MNIERILKKYAKNNQIIRVCHGRACQMFAGLKFDEKAKEYVEKSNLKDVDVDKSGCMGRCRNAPNMRFVDKATEDIDTVSLR